MSSKFRLNGTIHEILRIATTTTHIHQCLLQKRPQSTKTSACEKQLDEKTCSRCKEDVCARAKPAKSKKRGLFGGLLGGADKAAARVPPPKEQCKIEQGKNGPQATLLQHRDFTAKLETEHEAVTKQQCQPVPDLKQFGGQPYKTCGTAYIIQKSRVESGVQEPQTKEEKIIRRIEAEPELKDKQEDPMPPYTTVEQRMMDLDERHLHPLYKKYQVTPRKICKRKKASTDYKTRSGPVDPKDYPTNLKFNKDLLEKKNMYAEYKTVQPPQQLVAKMLEIQQNVRPTLERKFPQFDVELQKAKARKNVYDTLNQQDSIAEQYVDK